MSRPSARLSERKSQPPGDRKGARQTRSPRQLTKVELELSDGRYLLAYANSATKPADA